MINHESFGDSQAQAAQKLVDFYEGSQLQYVIRALDGNDNGYGQRTEWRNRGFTPRVRNIVKPIVEKSATLFQKPAKFEILPAGSTTAQPIIDSRFNEIMMLADAQEFMKSVDVYTRLLKATCVLQQKYVNGERDTTSGIYRFDATQGDEMVPELLHRGNSIVLMDRTRTHITELAFLTSGSWLSEEWSYRHITPAFIRDVLVIKGEEQETIMPNPDGIVPATMFYDTGKPRAGVWPKIPEDLPSLQELINSHLTDMEFALANGKSQKLVLKNATVVDASRPVDAVARISETTDDGAHRLMPAAKKADVIGGIGSVINLTSGKNSAVQPDANYIGPDVDLAGHAEVIRQMMSDVCSDWSVNMKAGGTASASSGFSLIVQEMDNLTLREQRAQSFQAGFRRFYEVTTTLYPELTHGQLQVIFSDAALPVNKVEQQDLWEKRVASGFASVIDYLMQEEGLDEAEALRRADEIKTYNELYRGSPAAEVVVDEVVDTENDLSIDE